MAPNIPEMYEAHFGVPMTGGVLNSLNTRLDAAMVAFIIDHSETKVFLVDREFHRVVDRGTGDRQDPAAGRRHRRSRHARTVRRSATRPGRSSSPSGDPDFAWAIRRRMERDLAQLHVKARPAIPRASSTAIAARRCRPTATLRNGRSACIRSISGPCRCSTATAGASRGRWRWSPAPPSACVALPPSRSSMALADPRGDHMCGAPIIMQLVIGATSRPSAGR